MTTNTAATILLHFLLRRLLAIIFWLGTFYTVFFTSPPPTMVGSLAHNAGLFLAVFILTPAAYVLWLQPAAPPVDKYTLMREN